MTVFQASADCCIFCSMSTVVIKKESLAFMIVHHTFDLLIYRDRRVKLLLQKLRKATMSRGSLRSARRDAHLTPILKNNLAVEGCWPAFLHALGSVDVLTGKKNVRYLQISYV
jgi:hypothetical protein